MSSNVNPAAKPGAFSPFRFQAFVLLWGATLVSNIGTWMHEVGAGWLMTELNPSPAVVTLVQAATTLPVFLFALFAGTLADRVDKRWMLIVINVALVAIISALTLLVWQQQMTPLLLILFTFAVGTGAAFMAPAWQAVVPQLIPRKNLKSAIALNSMGINISRAIGPAIAGFLIASVGPAAPFALNAVSHVLIVIALLMWRAPAQAAEHHGPLFADMRIGIRHVRHNPPLIATLVRALAFFVFASAYWSLLPLIARNADGGGEELYGLMLALIGTGAVAGALLLPRFQGRFSSDAMVQVGTFGTVFALLILAFTNQALALMAAAFLGGLSWIAVLASFHVSAQLALPDWVRARGLAVFLMVFFGSMALGSVIWGQLATATTITTALIIAAVGLGLGWLVTRGFPVGLGENLDLTPASAWPEAPSISEGMEAANNRPAMVRVEYHIAKDDLSAFLKAVRSLSKERYRDGANRWSLYQNVEDETIWIESFELPTWAEHLAQHERMTKQDADLQATVRAFDTRKNGPTVRHYLSHHTI